MTRAIRDWNRSILSKIMEISKSAIQYIDFNRKLLSSQITHRNEPVLFRIVRTTPFHRVLTHFCERSVSRAIRDWNRSILWKIMEISKITIFQKISKSAIQYIDFNRKLLGSQMTHWNEPVLFGILRTSSFHRVLTHFCELSVGWEISRGKNRVESTPPPLGGRIF